MRWDIWSENLMKMNTKTKEQTKTKLKFYSYLNEWLFGNTKDTCAYMKTKKIQVLLEQKYSIICSTNITNRYMIRFYVNLQVGLGHGKLSCKWNITSEKNIRASISPYSICNILLKEGSWEEIKHNKIWLTTNVGI